MKSLDYFGAPNYGSSGILSSLYELHWRVERYLIRILSFILELRIRGNSELLA